MVCLDSDILVGFLRKDENAVAFLEDLEKRGEVLNTTIINVCELFEGANLFHQKEEAEKSVEQLVNRINVLYLSKQSAQLFGKITSELNKKGTKLEDFDVLIAAIALENNEAFVTRNLKHFNRIEKLKVIEW